MSSIHQVYPLEYSKLMTKVDDNIAQGNNTENIIAYAYIQVNSLFLRSLETAPDQPIQNYLKAVLELYQRLYIIDPNLIIKLESGDFSFIFEMRYLLNQPEFNKIFTAGVQAKKEVIESGVKKPVEPIEILGKTLLRSVMDRLSKAYGSNAVSATFDNVNKNTVISNEIKAKIIIEFYQEVLRLDLKDEGNLMRYIGMLANKKLNP